MKSKRAEKLDHRLLLLMQGKCYLSLVQIHALYQRKHWRIMQSNIELSLDRLVQEQRINLKVEEGRKEYICLKGYGK